MSPTKLQKAEEIFRSALELPPADRATFLFDSCGADDGLRREVESMLSKESKTEIVFRKAPAAEAPAEPRMADLVGQKINQYKIISLLGMGGMGAVYLARDTTLERKVAVKLLGSDTAADAGRLERFFQEAKSASALNHPNILTVHEIGDFGESRFIVTEFIDGQTLNEYLKDEQPPPEKILEIAAQIASALSSAHEAGIVHRDIKPDNVMLRRDGIVKILDFGIAKLTDAGNSAESPIDLEAATRARVMTLPGMIIGTPQYMSPEQARGQKVDNRSDIFSFGALLYEMLSGCAPFTGTTNMDIIGSILRDEPKPLREILPDISAELEHIVLKTLRKDREQRYQHIKDVLIDLNDVKKTLEFHSKHIHHTGPDHSRKTIEETARRAAPARFSALQVLSLLLVLSAVAAAAMYWQMTPRGTTSPQNTFDLKTTEVANWSSSPGEIYSVGSFSPDARMVAFASTRSGSKNIWVKQTVSGEAVQITKDEYENKNPIWSPAGDEVAFFSTKGNQAGIWRIPYLGGSPVFVAEIMDASSQLKFWSKQNRIYYESKNEIYAADADSGQITKKTDFAAKNVKAAAIAVAPDENRTAYVTLEDKIWNLWSADLQTDAPRKLLSGAAQIRNLVWHPDGTRIFFSSPVDGTFQIFVIAAAAAEPPRQLTFAESDILALDVSGDGTKILFGSAKEESDVWGVNLKDSKEFAVAASIDSELWTDVSPDGKTLAFQSIKNLSQGNKLSSGNILTKKLGEKETVLAANAFLPKWSPDGKTLAFMRAAGNKMRIETVNAGGGGQTPLTKESVALVNYTVLPYNRTQASDFSWSPDSQTIAYVSDQNGYNNLWLIDADGSNETLLTGNDTTSTYVCPLWSADGRRLAFASKTNNLEGKPTYTISIIDLEDRKIDQILSGNTFVRLLGWDQSGQKLLLASVEKGQINALPVEVSLLELEVESKKTRETIRLKETYLYNIHLSPDKKKIAFVAHRDDCDNVWTMPASGGAAVRATGNNDSRLYFSTLSWSSDGNFIFFGKQSRFSLLSMLTNFK